MKNEDFVYEAILAETAYSNKSDNPLTFTASMMGNTLLQNYLTIVHGTPKPRSIGANTIGSIFHTGMEKIIADYWAKLGRDDDIPSFVRAEKNLQIKHKVGDQIWTISGTADIIIEGKGGNILIGDYKLAKQYAFKRLKNELGTHPYAQQLHVLAHLCSKNFEISIDKIKLCVFAFSKDAKALNGEPEYQQIFIPSTPSDINYTMAQVQTRIDLLNDIILEGGTPTECSKDEKWFRNLGKGKGSVPTRCLLYCDHFWAGNCPYESPWRNERSQQMLMTHQATKVGDW